MQIKFFKSPLDFRKWLEKNHDKAQELWVGFYKKDSGKPSLTWPESVDQALCFGWIDGVRKSVDALSYAIRFTPRRPASIWSAINLKRIQQLTKAGRMHSSGLKVFQERDIKRAEKYSFEQRKNPKLASQHEKLLRANKKAWAFFQAQPPWYQRTASWWVISAKKEETKSKRLATLIEASAQRRPIAPLDRRPKQTNIPKKVADQ